MAATKRRKADTSNMTAEEKAAYEERLAKARAPKPAYLVYKLNEDGSLDIREVTRSAEEALAVIDGDKELKYQRFMLK